MRLYFFFTLMPKDKLRPEKGRGLGEIFPKGNEICSNRKWKDFYRKTKFLWQKSRKIF